MCGRAGRSRLGSKHARHPHAFATSPLQCLTEAEALLKQWGRNELEEKATPSWLIYLRQVRCERVCEGRVGVLCGLAQLHCPQPSLHSKYFLLRFLKLSSCAVPRPRSCTSPCPS